MGIIQEKMMSGFAEQFKDIIEKNEQKTQENLEKVAQFTNEVSESMNQVKAVLKEIQLCLNNNSVWIMKAQQSMCNKLEVKLNDPLEEEQ